VLVSTEPGLQAELDAAGERYASRVREALRAGCREAEVPYEVVAVSAGGALISAPLRVPRGVTLTGPSSRAAGQGVISYMGSKDDLDGGSFVTLEP
jgi:hypothetical protein